MDNETLNDSDCVIENSVVDDSTTSDNDANVSSANSDVDLTVDVNSTYEDLLESINVSGSDSDELSESESESVNADLTKSLVTSDINVSNDDSHSVTSEVHNISDEDTIDLNDSVEEKKVSKIYAIDSSDESIVEITGSGVKLEPYSESKADVKSEPHFKSDPSVNQEQYFKSEPGVKLESYFKPEPGVKLEPQFESEAGAKSEYKPRPSLNPTELVNDVKAIHTGKTGMETFNNQQKMALDCMRSLCESLEKKPSDTEMADNPKQLKIELMPHQRTALTWMLWRESQRPKGGILADDMGLGKTMSMISLVVTKRHAEESPQSDAESESDEDDVEEVQPSWIAKGSKIRSRYYGGTLVVCPASIMDQWKAEVKNRLRSNSLTVVLHHGSNRETMPRRLSKHDMVITTYGIVSSECEGEGVLFSIKWERIILDEAHIIRNHTSKQSIACCKLKASARWALTGTPIQNKEADLFPLLKFLRCRPFDDYSSFKMWISKTSSKSQERLNQVLQALLIRRTKEDLKEMGQIESLPEKRKEIVAVKLTTEEMNVYQKVMIYSQTLFAQYLHQRDTRNNFTSEEANSDQKNEWMTLHQQISRAHGATPDAISGHHILILILRLRQICIHPSLIHAMLSDGEFEGGDSDTENVPEVDLLEQLSKLQIGAQAETDETVSKASSKVLLRSNPVFDETRISSKFQKIIEFISDKLIGTGDKGIVVSQFASVLNMLGDHLKDLGIRFVMLTGQTKIESRNQIVTDFNRSSTTIQVMLLSLTAGGVGLNLVGANHLFFVDPHWNPQLENQAQDRIYRLGQKKPVTIYKFLCDDTIERRIQHLQESKLEIANQVLTGAKRTNSKLTLQDMKTLFDL